jgi:hypothetical protein
MAKIEYSSDAIPISSCTNLSGAGLFPAGFYSGMFTYVPSSTPPTFTGTSTELTMTTEPTLDPITGDPSSTTETSPIINDILAALATTKNSSAVADYGSGSDRGLWVGDEGKELAFKAIETALKPFVDYGLIHSLRIETATPNGGQLKVRIVFKSAQVSRDVGGQDIVITV